MTKIPDEPLGVQAVKNKRYKNASISSKGYDIYLNIEIPDNKFSLYKKGSKEVIMPIIKELKKIIPDHLKVDIALPTEYEDAIINKVPLLTVIVRKGMKLINSEKFVEELLKLGGELRL